MSKFLDVAIQAIKEAELIVMKNFGKSKEIRFKGDINPVTEVDIESEKNKESSERNSGK